MGQPKLLFEFSGHTLIGRVVRALRAGGIERVVVVAPPADAAEGPAIARAASDAGAEAFVPVTRPRDMRESIEYGLDRLAGAGRPDRVMVTPADHPGITAELVANIAEYAARHPESLVIPTYNGLRGHPIILPWYVAGAVRCLPAGAGLNAVVAQHSQIVDELAVRDAEVVRDLDTPEDLEYWHNRQKAGGNLATKMEVSVRLFALAKERAGRSEITIELASGSTIRDLRMVLADSLPILAPLIPTALIALNEEYARDSVVISAGSRLALIPPVSGGTHGRSSSVPTNPSKEDRSRDD